MKLDHEPLDQLVEPKRMGEYMPQYDAYSNMMKTPGGLDRAAAVDAGYTRLTEAEIRKSDDWKREQARHRIYQTLETARMLDNISDQLMALDFVDQAKAIDTVIDALVSSWAKDRTKMR